MASIIYAFREQAPLKRDFMNEATLLQRQGHQRIKTKFGDMSQDPSLGQPGENFILNRFSQPE
ncbi:MAG: hypothetical protein F4069_06785 [Rhodothermaceae bacterium]|nr:hypothetical protein [Rhodothermaceae bacterium]MYE62294.1 hypothetical protein [Rhodothermaceae bacterium]MYJ19548.1 hypothetical protein [Rhodothermaceae bacterium]MYJ45019.1 hypothetical protein [Rhodothermaceae bacterium]